MKRLIRKWLMGDTVFSEYTKITTADDLKQHVWLTTATHTCDVSERHWLLCIHPMVFGVWVHNSQTRKDLEEQNDATLYFGGTSMNDIIEGHEAETGVTVIEHIPEKNGSLFLLKLSESSIHHISLIKRCLIFFRYYRKDGLTYQRFKSYVSAYSFPRRIRIVSFRDQDYYNIFPMDLLGEIPGENRWVFGLRHSNKALSRIIRTGKIVVCEVPYQYKEKIYALGNHHSTNPPPLDLLGIQVSESKEFRFHIPVWADSYNEIRIHHSINLGSHMLLWGETVSQTIVREPSSHLFLIHFLHYLEQKKKGAEYMIV